jgi:uncharacterized protein YbgA (DUF1722 family)/uncharacterized protein YbbK (DUF523 family)
VKDDEKLRIGVSQCLLGEEVRFDGGHKRNRFVMNTLSYYVAYTGVCPEVEVGMPTPREAIRLSGTSESPRLIGVQSATDHTDAMEAWSSSRLSWLEEQSLDGYIFKKDSPSCGLFRVRVYDPDSGVPSRDGRGVFARAVVDAFPLLPVEEEGRLNDPPLRENFISRIFIYHRWKAFLAEERTPAGLVHFHTIHKMSFLAHSPSHYRELGRIVSRAGSGDLDPLLGEYAKTMTACTQVLATTGKHTNVIMHLMGFIKDKLDARDKAELLDVVEQMRNHVLPLIVPITLLKHHLWKCEVPEWVHSQIYLSPYPGELMLRNHV